MTDNLRERLADWVHSVLSAAAVSYDSPADGQTGAGVSLYLLELAPFMPAANARRQPLQLTLRYLVTTWAADSAQAENMLLDLAFAAMENADFEAEVDALPSVAWAAFNVKPRPAFLLRVPYRRDRPEPAVPRVRQPLVMQPTPAVPFLGVVVGPGDFPLAGAYVQIPAMQLSTRTDALGRFRFAALPAQPRSRHLRVSAKGRVQELTVDQPEPAGEPIVIRFELGEE